jgi:hypothetical protein
MTETPTQKAVRTLPPVASGKPDSVPSNRSEETSDSTYVPSTFSGTYYLVSPTRMEEEPPASERLAALLKIAAQSEAADYPDDPEQAAEQTELTRALYGAQASAMSALEDPEQ